MLKHLTRLFKEEKGQGMTEYALILGVIVGILALITASPLGTAITDAFANIAGQVSPTTTTPTP
ncbi:Flp family type IVb pilin [Ammoniphilus sp. CFH 90114]|uniref:Flp family type IVb pilin n=1 Tax=Ammoniphilus sp. CFH 90114 TaxID=2493665 RepID=UPI00100EC3A5|nr:Flp family type IVb pilin [Ammoniphilus sp. CFH 90114]RXT13560.1 Flp family type IVb pilin [Ammoniphilus sp. CFH 90114]